jgi:uncharacterized Zn finger protein
MTYGYEGWAPYVPVAERRRMAEREMAKLREKGHPVAPVRIHGRTIAGTFWGKAWCNNLESYRDYENRLPRGRTYVRNGSVVDLQVAPLEVRAMVSGSSLYTVKISIKPIPKAQWQSLCRDCTGAIDSLVELIQGRFSTGVMERLCRQDTGLFPRPSEIRFSCSCPDPAAMCKHVAAVLYGVGARLDEQPELLFRLRAVDPSELAADLNTTVPFSKAAPAVGKILESEDLAELFGLDIAEEASPASPSGMGGEASPIPKAAKKRARSRIAGNGAEAMKGNTGQKAVPVQETAQKVAEQPSARSARTRPNDRQQLRRRKSSAVWDPSDIYKP